jgi:hypothetical protein
MTSSLVSSYEQRFGATRPILESDLEGSSRFFGNPAAVPLVDPIDHPYRNFTYLCPSIEWSSRHAGPLHHLGNRSAARAPLS